MNFGEEMTGQLFYDGDVDWYKISVIGGGTLTLDGFINGKEGKSEWSIHLYREGEFDWSNPEWMMGHRWWGSSVETYVLGEAGTYYFKVYSDSQTHSDSTYKLTPNFELGLSGVETEPNGDNENADVMNFGEEITGELADASDVDWYKLSVAGAGTLTLDRVIMGKRGNRNGEFIYIEKGSLTGVIQNG